MAKFTSTRDLDLEYEGHKLRGPAGTVFRLPDSLRTAFVEDFASRIPGITWIVQDEISASGGTHPDLAEHLSIGTAAASVVSDHLSASDAHVMYALDADLANHETEGHVHSHAISSVTNLQSSLDGKATTSHSHVDGDLPAGLARDSEVTSAIADHAATPHGGSLPSGLIVMWGGAVSAIPSGWLLCDGQNGTPDLRDRFIKGAAVAGATGGSATHGHTVTQPDAHTDVLNHTHPITDPGHVHDEYRNSASTGGLDGWAAGDTSTNTATLTGYDTGSKVTGISVNNPSGGVASQPHTGAAVASSSNEPPYYALCFIQKT